MSEVRGPLEKAFQLDSSDIDKAKTDEDLAAVRDEGWFKELIQKYGQ